MYCSAVRLGSQLTFPHVYKDRLYTIYHVHMYIAKGMLGTK